MIESVSDPYMLRVTPQHFEQHLQVIREIGVPMRLDELARNVCEGHLPEGAVCVTFDDGYQDNLSMVKPLLERYDIPATVFMTTGTGGRSQEFWWDELERVFLQPHRLPAELHLNAGGQHVEVALGEASDYSEADLRRDSAWTLLDPSAPTSRHTALRAVYQLVQPMGVAERQQVLDGLLSWAGLVPTVRPTNRTLQPEEVVALEHGGLVAVGAHTVNHPDLSVQSAEAQRDEIYQSKFDLERWLGHAVQSFAYPFGEYSQQSVTLVGEAGFQYACACMSRNVRRDSAPFLLPRVDVFDWDGEEFARQLQTQLGR